MPAIRVGAGAFGPGQPHRDLYLSPDHAILAEGVLIPVKYLIDGHAIAPIETTDAIYYHIELTRHDAILAEGLPVESYLDTEDRTNFANAGGAVRVYPDFAPATASARREAHACAPIVVTGPILHAARLRRQASNVSRMAWAST